MKTKLFFILFILLCNHLFAQPFQIGHTTVTLVDKTRNNRNIPTEIYYPADVSGDNVAVTKVNTDKFPVLGFGHGFVMTWDAYKNIWDVVVPEGFIIAFPKTEGSISPSHLEFGKDIAFVLSELAVLGQTNSSLFYNRIDSMNCALGHSMGGGSAFLAAQFDSTIKTIATLAPAETKPSAIMAADGLNLPALIFTGGNDCVTPPLTNQLPMYDSLQSACKTFISINGGSHCQMAESNFLCNFGEATCMPQPSITRIEQHIVINRYLLPWLKDQLKKDCVSGEQFNSTIVIDPSIVFQKTCLLCNATSVHKIISPFIMDAFPNPFNDKIVVQCKSSNSNKIKIELYLINGNKIFSKHFLNVTENEKVELNVEENLPAGIYVLKVTSNGEHSIKKLVKH